ncbi:MAG: DUF4923 family protein, partial [Prevotella sp.]|nr:DUF4923 family protein [Prevotella sp.]
MKIMRIWGLVLALLTMSQLQAQTVKETVDSVKSGLKASSVKEAYEKVNDSFKLKKASADSLIGTWCYKEPAVYATKGNLLLKMAENAVANQIEKLLQSYIDKSNITSENTEFTFHSDGKFERVIAGRKAQGVWLTNGEKLVLGIGNVMTADITTHHENGELMLLLDVDKLMTGLKNLGAMKDNKTNKQLIKLTKRIPGLQGGILL